MHNLYPTDQELKTADAELSRVIGRLDSLLLVMKSCKGSTCHAPWRVLHPDGDVHSLDDALQARFDDFYESQAQVSFDRCEAGYIIDAEGPQVGYQYRGDLGWSHWG
jgi:arylsulfatase